MAGRSRRTRFIFSLRGEIFSSEPEASPPSDPPNAPNIQAVETNTPNQQVPTMFFVIAGMASMLFLIIIAIALLCYSHYINHYHHHQLMNGGRRRRSSRGLFPANSNSSLESGASATPREYGPLILVRVPGHDEPTYFAHPAPLSPDRQNSEGTSIDGSSYTYTSGFNTPSPVLESPPPGIRIPEAMESHPVLHHPLEPSHNPVTGAW